MSEQLKSALVSAVTTFAVAFLGLALTPDFSWTQAGVLAAVVAAGRTAVAALNPLQTLYGNGAK